MRIEQLNHLALTPFISLLGLIGLYKKQRRTWLRPIFYVILFTTLAYGLLEYGGNYSSSAWLHTSPYTLLLLWLIVGPLAISSYPKLAKILLIVSAIVFLLVWVVDPVFAPASLGYGLGSLQWTMVIAQIFSLAALMNIGLKSISRLPKEG